MTCSWRFIFVLLLQILVINASSDFLIQMISERPNFGASNTSFCESWKFAVETNDLGPWKMVPQRCIPFMWQYMTATGRYSSDSDFAAACSLEFAMSLNVSKDRMDAWIFDIDETLLSNLPYYQTCGFGSTPFNETSFNEWMESAKAPELPASLALYNELKRMGFTIFLLTGRDEWHRNVTETNLRFAGYHHWKKLFLRGPSDQGKPAVVYKSEKREDIKRLGYRIQGNSGDQWSDLLGSFAAKRSFKLPNPMYFIS